MPTTVFGVATALMRNPEIVAAMQEAGIQAKDVDRVLLTGGSAYIPAFRSDLSDTFGPERLEQRDAFTAVVHGLGVHAQHLWGAA